MSMCKTQSTTLEILPQIIFPQKQQASVKMECDIC